MENNFDSASFRLALEEWDSALYLQKDENEISEWEKRRYADLQASIEEMDRVAKLLIGGDLRAQVGSALGVPEDTLLDTQFLLVEAFIPDEENSTSMLDRLEFMMELPIQFLTGKYLEIVITIQNGGFEIAEFSRICRPPLPDLEFRRSNGSLSFSESYELRRSLSEEELGKFVVTTIQKLSARRRRRYRRCRCCYNMIESGSLFCKDVCLGCAPNEFGLVF